MTSAGARPPRLRGSWGRSQSRCAQRTRWGHSSWTRQPRACPYVPALGRCAPGGAAEPPTVHAARVESQFGIESVLNAECVHALALGPRRTALRCSR